MFRKSGRKARPCRRSEKAPARERTTRRHARAAGVVAVELALVLPFLVFVLTALFDLGLAAYEAMLVESAAAAGARYAQLHAWDPSAIAAIVAGATGSGGIAANPAPSEFCACPATGSLAPVDCGASCPDGSRPSFYGEVNAQLQHFSVLHYPALPQPLVLTGEAVVRLR
jgi:TadE-like protein